MGDIADDVIMGFQCSWCGVCFEDEHGYPVICKSCAKGSSKEERGGLQIATLKEL